MNNTDPDAVQQMSATCAALQLLMAGREITRLRVFSGTEWPEKGGEEAAKAAMKGISTLLVKFRDEGHQLSVEDMFLIGVLNKRRQVCVTHCSFIRSDDGRFALRLKGPRYTGEFIYSRSSNRLVCRAVDENGSLAHAELEGSRALITKASEAKR